MPCAPGLTVAGVALAVTVAVSLGGFMLGYRGAIDKSINMLGFQVMIMAKGCPYEAATMMLKGGTGLLYLPADTYEKVKSDPDIETITPIFVGVAQKQGSSIRDDAGASNFSIISGIDVPSYQGDEAVDRVQERPWLRRRSVVLRRTAGTKWFWDSKPPNTSSAKSATRFYASITPAGQARCGDARVQGGGRS